MTVTARLSNVHEPAADGLGVATLETWGVAVAVALDASFCCAILEDRLPTPPEGRRVSS